jgi:hypothetical protein
VAGNKICFLSSLIHSQPKSCHLSVTLPLPQAIFMRGCTVVETANCFIFVRLSACIGAAFIGEISIYFFIGFFHGSIFDKLNFVEL